MQARAALKYIAGHAKTADLLKRCSVSSDSFGSLPVFEHGRLVEYKVIFCTHGHASSQHVRTMHPFHGITCICFHDCTRGTRYG